ncbi:putative swr1-complex protein 5 [Erysiphe necator]|uniref:SWR1-complex protein 5 n=1 Tax=Uncinula necator TaxID=52586 RepID=A0A0B1NYR5_UNCNE|nr:putative swr1-complex protein 5 [Erysiphe necator]
MLLTDILSDEEYNSSEDSDFTPGEIDNKHEVVTLLSDSDSDSGLDSESDSDSNNPLAKKRKHLLDPEVEVAEIHNSGDEKITSQPKHELKSTKKAKFRNIANDRGGGIVKTRSQCSQEKKVIESQHKNETAVTIDVDAVWEAMNSGKPLPNSSEPPETKNSQSNSEEISLSSTSLQTKNSSNAQVEVCSRSKAYDEGPNSMIKIKQTYKFAGKFHFEEKIVARGSAEAKLYLKSLSDASKVNLVELETQGQVLKIKRPPKLARTSIFEPSSHKMPQRTDLRLGVRRQNPLVASDLMKEGKKLNTVEKSIIDWAGFVDKEGIADELEAASKSKHSYKTHQEFLARVEQKKEEESRRARGFTS